MAIIKRVGLPENDSERRTIRFLAEQLPGEDFVLFHNLELTNSAGFPFEYDIILVGEYAVYAIEAKHYGGTLRGNEHEWELESSRIIGSPMPLANKKAKILRDRLRRYSPVLGDVFVCALIALTREPVRLQIRDEQRDRILPLADIPGYILDPRRLPVAANRITHLTDRICDAIMRQFTPLHRTKVIGEYEIVEPLDRTDLYRSYLARHRLLRSATSVLLKEYTLNIYAEKVRQQRLRDLLTRDAEALSQLGAHPNIVQVVGFFPWEDDKFVLALDWPSLHSLRGRLTQRPLIPEDEALMITAGILEGLQHAHKHGVIHRNLRPESVLVGGDETVKLANFDLARVENGALETIATRVSGMLDPRYAAPEILGNPRAASPQSDIYAVGRILVEMLTDSVTGSPTGDIGELVRRLTNPDPAMRYSTAASAAEDVAILR